MATTTQKFGASGRGTSKPVPADSQLIEHHRNAGMMPQALLRVGLYILAIISPLLLAAAVTPETDHPFVQEVAKSIALVAYAILAMQFVIAARFRWVERPFGLDILFGFHKWMGIFAGLLFIAHPVLYASAGKWSMLYRFDQGVPILLGQVALVPLVIVVLGSVARQALRMEFEVWRAVHNLTAFTLLALGFAHSVAAGGDLASWPMRILWAFIFLAAIASYIHHKFLLPRRRRPYSFRVASVSPAAADVWSVRLDPLHDRLGIDYLPGQFMLITLYREGLPVEEHPFTISSSPASSSQIEATIKVSGDYTATIGETKVGDRAMVSGPFGRFSYALHPGEDELVFIAGGVGVTPMLSMLRHMRDTASDKTVVMLYGSRTERDIVARAELDEIAAGIQPNARIVHVLSSPDSSWTGERGRIDEEMISKYVPDIGWRVFYVSGPPAMIAATVSNLIRLGVPRRSIRAERFEL